MGSKSGPGKGYVAIGIGGMVIGGARPESGLQGHIFGA